MITRKLRSASDVPIVVEVEQKFNDRGLVIGDESRVRVAYRDKVVFECADTLADAPLLNRTIRALKEDMDIEGNPMDKPKGKAKTKTKDIDVEIEVEGGEIDGD